MEAMPFPSENLKLNRNRSQRRGTGIDPLAQQTAGIFSHIPRCD
jgi:hypothetical protein